MTEITEAIIWHKESDDPAPSSSSYGVIELLVELQLLAIPGPRGCTISMCTKHSEDGCWYEGKEKYDPSQWAVNYWAHKPEGPSAI